MKAPILVFSVINANKFSYQFIPVLGKYSLVETRLYNAKSVRQKNCC